MLSTVLQELRRRDKDTPGRV